MRAEPVTIEDKIEEVRRELDLRKRNYPRWIEMGRMSKAKATRQIAIMETILHDYEVKAGAVLPL